VISFALIEVDSGASPEKLARALLWIWVAISYPVALVVGSELVLGRRPEELFRRGISARLTAAGACLAGDDRAFRRELERLERMGREDISSYAKAGPAAAASTRTRLLAQVDLLLLLLREVPPGARMVLRWRKPWSRQERFVALRAMRCSRAGASRTTL